MIIEFDCTKYTKVTKGKTKIPSNVNLYCEQGGIDLHDIHFSKFPKVLSQMPISAQKELDEKGETVFTVKTVKRVTVKKADKLNKPIIISTNVY